MELKADPRTIKKSKVKSLRAQNILPGVIFGLKKPSVDVQVGYNDFVRVFKKSGETEIVDLKVGETEYPVLIEEIQYHPVAENILHVNFRLVDITKVISVNVPVNYFGQEGHPLIKNGTAILLTQFDEIEVEALPRNLPKSIELDVSTLKEIGDTLTIQDLKTYVDPEKVTVLEENDEMVIASLDYAIQPEVEIEGELTEEELISSVEASEEKEDDDAVGKSVEKPSDKTQKEESK